MLLSDNFDAGTANWTLGPGWTLVASENGQALQGVENTAPAQLNQGNLLNVVVQVRVHLTEGALQLSVHNGGDGGYAALLRADGQVGLFRDGVLIQAAPTVPAAPDGWRTLQLSALNDVVRVSVDNAEAIAFTDPTPLPAGTIALQAFGAGSSGLLVDDFAIWVAQGEIPATLTSSPTETALPLPTSTLSPTSLPPEPPLQRIFFEDFADGYYTAPLFLVPMLELVPDTDRLVLQLHEHDLVRIIPQVNPVIYQDIVAQVSFLLTTGTVQLSGRQQGDGTAYTASVDASGQVTLYKGTQVLASTTVAPLSGQWHSLRLSAIGGTLRIRIDETEVIVFQDESPLPEGVTTFAGINLGTDALWITDISVFVPAQ